MPTSGGGSGGSDMGQASFGPISLASGVPKTAIRIKAATTERVRILGYGFFFDGNSNSARPVEGRIGRISTDGVFAAGDPEPDEEELSSTFQTSVGIDASVEPTYSGFLKTFTVHPQLGCEHQAQEGQEVHLKPGGLLGFVFDAPDAVNIRGYVHFQE